MKMDSQRGEFTAANVFLQMIIFFQATHQHLNLAEGLNDADVNSTRALHPRLTMHCQCRMHGDSRGTATDCARGGRRRGVSLPGLSHVHSVIRIT